MQEAAEAMIWETFQGPGPTDQVLLPPQTSRDTSLTERTVSFGQPLQLMDSGEVLPYKGKGKGRARDFDQAQQFTAWEEANMGGAGSFDLPGPGNDFTPSQELLAPSGQFSFVPGQFKAWQPRATARSQSRMQRESMRGQTQIPQILQGQTLPPVGPQTAQVAQDGQTSPFQWLLQAQLPLQQAFQPPPGFPQQPASPGRTYFPGTELPQLQVETAQHTNIQPLPPMEIPKQSGYHFQPGRGFICHVCSACVRKPDIHRFEGQNRWCWADGEAMRQDDEANVRRWPKRAKMDLYVP